MPDPALGLQGWTPALQPIPAPIADLLELAGNFRWTYEPPAWKVFERIGGAEWESGGHNPIRMLARMPPDRLAAIVAEPEVAALIRAAHEHRWRHMADRGWFEQAGQGLPLNLRPFQVAYFCAEFGLAESFQIYSGGLGLLAGDHLKSASDLGLPFIAVGLLYRNGYFHQALDESGLQQELFPPIEAGVQPLRRVMDPSGRQLTVHVDLPDRPCACAIWRADVGNVRLYLLDTNIQENPPEFREITANLYLGDQRRRIEQEIVLGIGGVRALEALGEHPTVFHMNEGHAAFMALERIRRFRADYPTLTFDQAREAAAPSHIFTTHTPVPAGIDHFNIALVEHYFSRYHASLGLDMEGFMALGRQNVADRSEAFSMAVLAIRTSKWCNGVSALHGRVSRRMWRNIWPGVPEGDVPVGHVTNGIHTIGWVSPIMEPLYDRYLGRQWRSTPDDPAAWAGVDRIPDAELWTARNAARQRLVDYTIARAHAGAAGGCASRLRPDVLTIGFARRFAGYKRATLLFRDPDRLHRLLTTGGPAGRGFQLVVAGKSHPGDSWGKHLIRDIVEFAREDRFDGRILFLEDYGIDVAREMVRGCDLWLNNPIRGLEASGTSGMKAALNGVLNASILDGWWDEGFHPDAGYKIDDRGIYPSDAPDDDREDFESAALYRLLEQHILPDFYTRDGSGIPTAWTARMKRCIALMAPAFTTHRMVKEYAEKYYFPAHRAASRLASPEGGDLPEARAAADHIDRYRAAWPGVRVKTVDCAPAADGRFTVNAAVRLAGLRPEEVLVEAYHGPVGPDGQIEEGQSERLAVKAALGDTAFHFTGAFRPPASAATNDRYALCVRILPGDERLVSPFIPGLIVVGPCTALPSQVARA